MHTDLEHLLGDSTLPRVVIDDTDRPDSPYGRFVSDAPHERAHAHEVIDDEDVIAINYTSGTTGRQKGVMYTHRGAYLNALGEIIEVGYTSDTVFLWTLPMFHCNGWCNTWAVTAVGRHARLPAQRRLGEIWRLFDAGGRDPLLRRPGRTHRGWSTTRGAPAGTPVTVAVAAAPALPHAAGRDAAAEPVAAPPVRADGDLRPAHDLQMAAAVEPAARCDERAERLARQGVPFLDIEPVRVVDEDMRDVPADGDTSARW